MGAYPLGTGVTITETFTVLGTPTDPTTVVYTVQGPDGVDTVYTWGVDPEVTNPDVGVYVLDLAPPPDPGTYYYAIVGTGAVEAAGNGDFTILGSAVTQSDVAWAVDGPCQPWCDANDIWAGCGSPTITTGAGSNEETVCVDMTPYAQMASWLLWELSGRLHSGRCVRTVRPCGDTPCGFQVLSRGYLVPPVDWYYGYPGWGWTGWGWSWDHNDGCGCVPLDRINLAGYPVREILEVKIDGAVVPELHNWRLDKRRFLTRMADANGNAQRWPHCFPAGTLVLTDAGMKPIETVSVGDRVLTHKNRWKRVTWSGKTRDSEILTIRGRGGVLNCTPDHPVWAAPIHPSYSSPSKRTGVGEPDWVTATDLIGHVWATPAYAESLPIPLPLGWTHDDLPENFWWFVGRWIGDGWTDTAGRVTLCAGMAKRDEVLTVLSGMNWNWRESGGSASAARWRYNCPELRAWLRQHFGTSAHDKGIPGWLFGADEEIRRSFLDGYIHADGYSGEGTKGGQYQSIRTVSRKLAVGTKILAGTLGHAAVVYAGQANLSIDHPTYRINWPEESVKQHSWRDDDHIWNRVKSISLGEDVVPVYDLTVEDDHSFVADGFVVHNCQRLDEPDTELGTFSVTYAYGQDAPLLGQLAAAQVGCEIYRARNGDDCALPSGTVRVTRQGVTIDKMATLGWYRSSSTRYGPSAKWATGLALVDAFLNGINPYGLTRRPMMMAPGQRRNRFAQPVGQ